MKTCKKIVISGVLSLLFSITTPAAYAAQNLPCWIQRVEEHGGKLYIDFLPSYRQRAVVTTNSQERQDETLPTNATSHLVVWEGEAISIDDGLHSGCSIIIERHQRQLGSQTLAYVQIGGFPPSETIKFIPASTYDELRQSK